MSWKNVWYKFRLGILNSFCIAISFVRNVICFIDQYVSLAKMIYIETVPPNKSWSENGTCLSHRKKHRSARRSFQAVSVSLSRCPNDSVYKTLIPECVLHEIYLCTWVVDAIGSCVKQNCKYRIVGNVIAKFWSSSIFFIVREREREINNGWVFMAFRFNRVDIQVD